ncbi:MAG TPA: hypothetical protein VEY31_05655 [Roseococcus sp.]|jgi:hypothetical protein|nr:hypothetical protein [Roseococcus sp.]
MHAIDSFAITALQLGDHEVNRSFTRAALPHVTEVIEADASHDLVRTGEESGYYLLYNKVSELVDAVVHYQARSVEWFESSVTQCLLWRRPASALSGREPRDDIFRVVLSRHAAVVIDHQHGVEHATWPAMMAAAHGLSKRAGIADLNTGHVGWQEGPSLLEWLHRAGGDAPSARYVIA